MRYARLGLSVRSIQFLGRWRSSAVLRYIEEAMTELPMNANMTKQVEKAPQNQETEDKVR